MQQSERSYHKSIIKVVGVGGGGCKAVNYMFQSRLVNVSYALCHSYPDLYGDSLVKKQILLGKRFDGHNPDGFQKDAEERESEIRSMLNDGTKICVIVAGMGGGIGTGAAPVIARISKELGLLTIGIVTLPFRFEGNAKRYKAIDGIEKMAKCVDTIVVINNESMRQLYPETHLLQIFSKADETIRLMVNSIANLTYHHRNGNPIMDDVNTIFKEGGAGIITEGHGKGYRGVKTAIQNAVQSPLIYNIGIFKAKKVFLYIDIGDYKYLTKEDKLFINDFKNNNRENCVIQLCINKNIKMGKRVNATIFATGFNVDDINELKVFRPGNYEKEPMNMEQISALVDILKESPEKEVYYPWSHVCDSIMSYPEKVGIISEKCPICGHNMIEIYFFSPEWTWKKLCGRAGDMFICPHCRSQKHFHLTLMN